MLLRKVFAIFSAVLVGFSCSCLPSVISPAFAATTVGSDYKMTAYVGWSGASNPTYDGNAFVIPCSGGISAKVFRSTSSQTSPIKFVSAPFQEHSTPFTLYITLGITSNKTISMSNSVRYSNLKWYQAGTAYTATDAVYSRYKVQEYSSYGQYDNLRVSVPANANQIEFMTPFSITLNSADSENIIGVEGAWIVETGNVDVADTVMDILEEVRGIHGDTTNALSVLNQILTTDTAIETDSRILINILQSIDVMALGILSKTDDIRITTTDIYNLLRDSLADESEELDNKSKATAESIMQEEDSESFWNDKNTDNFNALDLDNFTFGNGVVNALGTVGTLFTSLWDSLGDTVVIFTFPLMLGITLVAIGRVSRSGGKGSKGKGGDDD